MTDPERLLGVLANLPLVALLIGATTWIASRIPRSKSMGRVAVFVIAAAGVVTLSAAAARVASQLLPSSDLRLQLLGVGWISSFTIAVGLFYYHKLALPSWPRAGVRTALVISALTAGWLTNLVLQVDGTVERVEGAGAWTGADGM